MAITHNFIETAGFKPTAGEITKAELAINLVDKTIWTKDNVGAVVKLGEVYDDSDVLKDSDTLSTVNSENKLVTESDISAFGGGDMVASQYDTGGAYTVSVDSADTVLGKTVLTDVPAGALFTDTNTEYTGGTGITLNAGAFNHDSHTGDVTGSTTLTIGTGKVTLAKMANMATASFIGRNTAATGVPEVLSAVTARAILNVENGAEVNNISDVNATDLTDGLASTLHYHATDRSRANHTGTQAVGTITGLGTSATVDTGTTSGTIPVLDGSGKIASTLLPALALTDVYQESTQVAQLALTVQEGDVCIRTDLNTTYIHNGGVSGTMADWSAMLTPDANTTNLGTGGVADGTYEITSSTGTNVTIPTATTSSAGMLSGAIFDQIVVNNGKVSNVSTNLGYTASPTNGVVTSSDGTNATLPLGTGTNAGLLAPAAFTKLGHITVTQAVNLDTIESNQIGTLLTGEAV